MRQIKHFLRSLWRNERGSALPIIGLSIFTLTAATGTAIDMGRVQIVQSRMQNALDAAGLAAGSVVNQVDINAEVSKYFYANFPQGYMGTQITNLTTSATADKNVLTLSVQGQVSMTFMQLLGVPKATVKANSQITRANKGMELVLIIDTTGSMDQTAGGSVTKLQAAKTASNTLLSTIFGSNSTLPNLWIGLVPFSQAVNIGAGNSSWTTANTFNWGTTSWSGCVDAREANSRDVTDDPPSVATFPQYYWPDDSTNNWISTTNNTSTTTICNRNSNCTCANYGPCTTTVSGNVTTTIACSGSGSTRSCTRTTVTATNSYTINSSRGPNLYCPQPVTPMTASKSTVSNAISAMTADGNTHVNLGLAWGWRMLSPRWRNVWPGEMQTNKLPLDYGTPLMNKVAILMTDGDNTISSSSRGAYWYLSDGKLGTTNQANAETQLDTRTSTICASMKAEGIIIYTIALGTDLSTTSKNMLKNCASKPEYYFLSPSTSTLQTVFTQIGDSLANLRISQ